MDIECSQALYIEYLKARIIYIKMFISLFFILLGNITLYLLHFMECIKHFNKEKQFTKEYCNMEKED